MENINKFGTEELIQLLSPSSVIVKELTDRGVIRSKNIVGDLGEFYAIEYYNKLKGLPKLLLAAPTVKNIDALSRDGDRYSVKCISSAKGSTGSFYGLEPPQSIESNKQKFEFLIIVILDKSFAVDKILELTWEDFLKHKKWNKRMNNYNISLTNKLLKTGKTIYSK